MGHAPTPNFAAVSGWLSSGCDRSSQHAAPASEVCLTTVYLWWIGRAIRGAGARMSSPVGGALAPRSRAGVSLRHFSLACGTPTGSGIKASICRLSMRKLAYGRSVIRRPTNTRCCLTYVVPSLSIVVTRRRTTAVAMVTSLLHTGHLVVHTAPYARPPLRCTPLMVALSSAGRGGGVLRVYSGSPTCQSLCCVKERSQSIGRGIRCRRPCTRRGTVCVGGWVRALPWRVARQ